MEKGQESLFPKGRAVRKHPLTGLDSSMQGPGCVAGTARLLPLPCPLDRPALQKGPVSVWPLGSLWSGWLLPSGRPRI